MKMKEVMKMKDKENERRLRKSKKVKKMNEGSENERRLRKFKKAKEMKEG